MSAIGKPMRKKWAVQNAAPPFCRDRLTTQGGDESRATSEVRIGQTSSQHRSSVCGLISGCWPGLRRIKATGRVDESAGQHEGRCEESAYWRGNPCRTTLLGPAAASRLSGAGGEGYVVVFQGTRRSLGALVSGGSGWEGLANSSGHLGLGGPSAARLA
ncbi:predicted protein [Uncinocarpus reesii 1704]|uniref:Uncharacterized protein n=1 Tax=Uncinocarpus reesii (strain UAMH 1704) TaxID=336963 RepID=C4JEB5_UNCRE|nr:uncharacterized protein UREG_00747 [Uncinocarpus reesii 1704]EEP75900.1 predicted protein [Uncinocarpus reesii 1704]